jgi:glycosyltransferase involved in cell wall biosynthesis
MRIAVNTRLLLPGKLDGIGWFTFETLKRITRARPDHEFIFIFDRPYAREVIFSDNIRPCVLRPQARHPLLWYWWFEYSLPAFLRKMKPDVFVSPDGYLSLSSDLPSVCVIHDINFHHRPGDLPPLTGWYYRYFFPRFAAKATRILTVSEYSRSDISSSYNIPAERISVAYNGANSIYTPVGEQEKILIREAYAQGKDYFVFVGTLHPRKNIPSLLRAFERFRQEYDKEFKLLIVGEELFMTGGMRKVLRNMHYRQDVVFTGRLPPGELHKVYCGATALTFVPFFEGFGIPVLEAMQCGTPVVSSGVTSLPEVGGDAVCYVDPRDTESICAGMIKITEDQAYRNKLVALGLEQCRKFSWERTAGVLWDSIESAHREHKD